MKRLLILSSLIFSNLISITAQDKFILLIESSPNYSYRTFKNISEISITTDDKSKIGYSVSLKAGYSIIKDLYIISGLEYNNKGFKTTIVYFDEDNYPEHTLGFLNLNFLEIPVYFKYEISKSKLCCGPVIGFSYGRLIGIISRFDSEKISANQSEIKNSGLNKFVINLHTGLELSYQFNNRYSFKIEPKFDYSATDLNEGENNLIKEHLYILGLNIGMKIKI